MNTELFDHARQRYQRKDYQGALMEFTRCLQDTGNPLAPGEMGLIYHQIGNCLVKLKNPSEAIQAYTQAASDEGYQQIGTVECNMGMAYASLRDYDNAEQCFQKAIDEPDYQTPYKAYMGLGNTLMKTGKSAEAGVAFREAALDENNPDPSKALLNLGVCFMALDRPNDAVTSYESALPFEMDTATRNRLYANLGQAYVSCGKMEKAVDAFEKAISDKTYYLSDSASVDYQRAIAAVSQGTTEMTQVLNIGDLSGLDVAADGSSVYDEAAYGGEQQDPFYYDEPYAQDSYPGYAEALTDNNEHFFNSSDEELEQWSKGLAKQDRKRRGVGLKILIVIIVIVLIAFAAGVFAFTQGYGWPTQGAVTKELFADPSANASSVLASDVSDQTKESIQDLLVQDGDITINGIDRGMSESTLFVTAQTPQGGDVQYKVSLVRDLIGWKISNVELYFPSQN